MNDREEKTCAGVLHAPFSEKMETRSAGGCCIGGPDLSTVFNFNIQAGAGTHYFIREGKAVSLQFRYLHFSNAEIDTPNEGVDSLGMVLAYNWFF